MSKQISRARRATALVPLALLSAAWTASLAGVGGSTTMATASSEPQPPALPDGTSVPTQAIEAPASVSSSGALAPGIARGDAARVVSTASTSGIPSAALAAYQRAETVINAADKSCRLSWQLVAAIGRVESDHGRYGGNALDDQGVATPGIFGIPLDGTNNTQAISDTDAGQFDNDAVWDRAVGPMQFIPSTWSVVGVDADGDAQRNPQDIDDAALATAVYLCSGDDDLSSVAGQRAAVYRYNHSESYVDLVLSIMNAYLEGDFMPVPNGSTAAAGYIVPDPGYTVSAGAAPGRGPKNSPSGNGGGTVSEGTPSDDGDKPSDPDPTTGPLPDTDNEDDGDGGPKGGLGIPGAPTVTVPPLPSTGVTPVDQVLTYAQAVAQCTLDGHVDNLLRKDDPFDKCVAEYTKP